MMAVLIQRGYNIKIYPYQNDTYFSKEAGQQIRYIIDSFQNANFLISQPNPMILPLIGIVSEKRIQ